MKYRIFTTKEFDDNFYKLDKSDKIRVRKILNQLKENGGSSGKPLKFSYFREKKFEGKRIYYLIYENKMIILAIAISNKKTQQKTINKIISELKKYEEVINKKTKQL